MNVILEKRMKIIKAICYKVTLRYEFFKPMRKRTQNGKEKVFGYF